MRLVDAAWTSSGSGPIPYTMLIAPGGKVIYRHTGAIDPAEVKKAIVEYLGRTYGRSEILCYESTTVD